MNVALVTGGSRGLGRALVGSLIDAGWDVVFDGRDGGDVAAAGSALGPHAHGGPGDVADPAHRAQLMEAVCGLGRLDLLVNNASTLGPTPLPPLRALSAANLLEILSVNVAAPLALVQAALPLLVAS